MLESIQRLSAALKWTHVVLIVGLGSAYFYWSLDQSELEQIQQAIESERQNAVQIQRKIEEAKDFERKFEEKKRHYAELVKTLQSLKEALPRQFLLPDLLTDLQKEARQLEVEILSVQPEANEVQGELYNTLGITINARASFPQFFVFLDRLAHTSRLVNVDSFRLERDPAKKQLMLGNEDGPFAESKLTGGTSYVSGLTGTFRILTYRYRGSPTGGGQ